MSHHLQVFPGFLAQEDLSSIQAQVFGHMIERLLDDPVNIRGRSQRGGQIVEQRQRFGAPRECILALGKMLD